jgi:hypothetical protein
VASPVRGGLGSPSMSASKLTPEAIRAMSKSELDRLRPTEVALASDESRCAYDERREQIANGDRPAKGADHFEPVPKRSAPAPGDANERFQLRHFTAPDLIAPPDPGERPAARPICHARLADDHRRRYGSRQNNVGPTVVRSDRQRRRGDRHARCWRRATRVHRPRAGHPLH